MNITKGLEPEIIFDKEVSMQDRFKWRRVIYTCFFSLSKSHQKIVPPFYIHNTMVQCLYETLDYTHPMIDKLMDSFSSGHVWSFAFMQESHLKNPTIGEDFRRIVVANTRTGLTPDLSSEAVVLHEIGHFKDFLLNGRAYNEKTKGNVEDYCNEYAIRQYIRLMCSFPEYFTYAKDIEIKEFEKSIRCFIQSRKDELGITGNPTKKQQELFAKEYTEAVYG